MATWDDIEGIAPATPAQLFVREPDRLSRMVVEEAGIRFDFAKTHLSAALLAAFAALAAAQGLAGAREALFSGQSAAHPAERGTGSVEGVAHAQGLHRRMRGLIDAIEADALGPITAVLHIGSGGAALGPRLLMDALGREAERYAVEIVATIDGAALEAAFARLDPATTLVAIASKTFAGDDILLNAASALAWLEEGGVADPYGQIVALTAAPDAAIAWGVDETRILPFAQGVGERQALWSSVGFPVALALGWDAFETLLEGAAAMDRHFRHAALERNAPVLAAFADLYEAQVRGRGTRAVFAYDDRLRLLPDYAAQVAMAVDGAPIIWGGTGTDAQAAIFGRLHRGDPVPAEFVVAIEPGSPLDDAHHRTLLANAFAQGAALMAGDRPSTTIMLDRLDPARLGALLAFYEHRAFVAAVVSGVDPFDEATDPGEPILHAIEAGEAGSLDASTRALIARALG